MACWAPAFMVLALAADAMGSGGIASIASGIARVLFLIFPARRFPGAVRRGPADWARREPAAARHPEAGC